MSRAFVPALLVLGCTRSPAPHEPTTAEPARSSAPASAPEAAPAMKQSVPPNTKLHRTAAGTPDATGWVLAHSTEGKFTILLPGTFSDLSYQQTDETTGAQVPVHLVSTQRANGVRYAAFCVPGVPAPNEVRSLGSLEAVSSRRELTVDGHRALEVTRGTSGVVRAISYDDRTCTLLVESQTQPATVPVDRADAQKMFESFRLDR